MLFIKLFVVLNEPSIKLNVVSRCPNLLFQTLRVSSVIFKPRHIAPATIVAQENKGRVPSHATLAPCVQQPPLAGKGKYGGYQLFGQEWY